MRLAMSDYARDFKKLRELSLKIHNAGVALGQYTTLVLEGDPDIPFSKSARDVLRDNLGEAKTLIDQLCHDYP